MKTHLEKGDKYTELFSRAINLNVHTKTEAADMLGISRPTLDTRLKTNMWKKSEKVCIKSIIA